MTEQKELENCNIIKSILMVLIVLYHSVLFFNGGWIDEVAKPEYVVKPLSIFASYLSSFHVYTFALVSGYIFYYIKFEKNQYQIFFPFIINKTKRLLVPYISVCILWVVPVFIVFNGFDISVLSQKYILGCSPSQLWFLLMLFIVFCIFFHLSDFIVNHTFWGLIVVLVLWGIGSIGTHWIKNFFQLFSGLKFCIFFYIGIFFRKNNLLSKINVISGFVIVSLHILSLIIYENIDGKETIISVVRIGIGLVLNVSGSVSVFIVLQKISSGFNKKFFLFLGKRSMCVYLIHQQIIYFIYYFLNGTLNPYLLAALTFVVTMIISILVSSLLLRFKPTRFLIGEKT